MLEDTADLIGLSFAAAGVFFSHALRVPRIDGGASIAIGVLLGAVARIEQMLTVQLGPMDVVVALRLALRSGLDAGGRGERFSGPWCVAAGLR